VRRTVDRDELQVTLDVLRRVPAAVKGWSEGNASLEPFEMVVATRALTSLSDSGGGRAWVSPRDCSPELARHAPGGSVDAILAVWPSDGTLELCGWGCSIGPGHEAGGAGFSSIVSDNWRSYLTAPHPEEGFVHGWLHQVEATYRDLGFGRTSSRHSTRRRSSHPAVPRRNRPTATRIAFTTIARATPGSRGTTIT